MNRKNFIVISLFTVILTIFTYFEGYRSLFSFSKKNNNFAQGRFEYKDGKYFGRGFHYGPPGRNPLDVQVIIQNGIVFDAQVTPVSEDPISYKMQRLFSKEISAKVVGRRMDEIHGRPAVNGSSLTGAAFLDALKRIGEQAKIQ